MFLEEGQPPPLHTFSLTKKTARLLRADFVLTKDPKSLYYRRTPCLFYHKLALRKASLGP